MTWTDERVEQLKKLWSDGLRPARLRRNSAASPCNAVIGKVHRLGLSGRTKAPSTSSAAAAQASGRPICCGSADRSRGGIRPWLIRSPMTTRVEAEQAPVENVIPMGQRRTLLELNEQTCRWPIGDPSDPGFLFLRRSRSDGPALLRLSLAHRLSAAGGAARQAADPSLIVAQNKQTKENAPDQNPGRFF